MKSYSSLVHTLGAKTADKGAVNGFQAVLRAGMFVSFFLLALPLFFVLLALQLVTGFILFTAVNLMKKRQAQPFKTRWNANEKVINPL